jgi:hypothetical protein
MKRSPRHSTNLEVMAQAHLLKQADSGAHLAMNAQVGVVASPLQVQREFVDSEGLCRYVCRICDGAQGQRTVADDAVRCDTIAAVDERHQKDELQQAGSAAFSAWS